MPKYTCERCLKDFKQKSHYERHHARKTPCQDNKDKIKEIVNEVVEEKLKEIEDNKVNKPTIDSEYDIIKKYYDNELNQDKYLVKTSNDEPTPLTCVEEMISKIPKEFWQRKDIKILDPCCGCGNFPVVIYFCLIKYHTKTYILDNILYFNDTNINRINILKKVFNHPINVYNKDFILFNTDIRFDLIIANPPYAKLLPNGKRASKNHNLIGIFIDKSLELLKNGGFLLYITPDNWMSYANRNTLIHRLTQLQIIYINIHIAKKYFKHIGSSFVWYLIEKKAFYKDIEIEGVWKKKVYKDLVKSEQRNYIPLYYNNKIQSILRKTIDNINIPKFKIETSSDLHRYTKKHLISNKCDDTYKYKLIHTPSQTVWSSRPHKYQDGYKVFIPTTSYYKSFVSECGMTQSITFILCDNKIIADNLNKVLSHPMYKFINDICRYGNFNNIRILQNFPYCNDYDTVYKKFNLTTEEQEFIENTILS